METISGNSGIRGSVESLIGGRNENQDSYGMAETPFGMLVVVCDGMGGGPAGKTASSIATQAILNYVSGAEIKQSPLSVLTDAVVSANESILAAVANNPALKGMGTTCVGVLVGKKNAYIVHVGDSRCYQLRAEKSVFRTSDHSYVGELVRRGSMTEEEARNSNYSNVITRAIGASSVIDPEVDTVEYQSGDRFALMSDGIWGTMPEPQLIKFLSQHTDPSLLVQTITQNIDTLGFDNGGGHDNLTLAVIDLPSKKVSKSLYENFSGTKNANTAKNNPTADPSSKVNVKPVSKQNKPKETHREGSNHNKNNAVAITRIIVVAVVICFVSFLYFHNKDTSNSPTEISQNEKSNSSEIVHESKASESSEKEDNTQPESLNRAAEVNDVANVISKEKSAIEEEKVKSTNPKSLENAYFRKAIDQLLKIKGHNRLDGETFDKVKKDRKAMLDEVLTTLQAGIQTCNDEKKSKATDIVERIHKSEKKIISIDTIYFRSTRESEEMINTYVKELEQLILL